MARTYIREGYTERYTNDTGSDIAREDLILIGSMVAVANEDIANGATGTVSTDGIHVVKKDATQAMGLGVKLYYNAANKQLTTTSSGNTLVATCRRAALAADTSVAAWLNRK